MPANSPPPTTSAASSRFPIAEPPDFPFFAGPTLDPRAFPFFANLASSLVLREQYALSAPLVAPAPARRQQAPRAGEEPDADTRRAENLTWQNIDASAAYVAIY